MGKLLNSQGKEIKFPDPPEQAPSKVSISKISQIKLSDEELLILSMAFLLDFAMLTQEMIDFAKINNLRVTEKNIEQAKRMSNLTNALLIPLLSTKNFDVMLNRLGMDAEDETKTYQEISAIIIKETKELTRKLMDDIISQARQEGEDDGKQ